LSILNPFGKYARGRARVQEILAEASPPQCPCGSPRKLGHIVCLECYQAAPAELRGGYRSLGTRRAATRALLAFARSRIGRPNFGEVTAKQGEPRTPP